MTEMKSWIFGKFGFIVLLICISCLYTLSIYFDARTQAVSMFRTVATNRVVNRTRKTILFWNEMFSDETFYFGKGDIFRNCPIRNCYATHDRTYSNVEDFDAILFHGNELYVSDLPKVRCVEQWYVYVNLESPENRPLSNDLYESYFNLTMTYRLDSDIPWPYAIVRNIETGAVVAPAKNAKWAALEDTDATDSEEDTSTLMELVKGKRKLVTWFVSNCPAKSGRMEYVKELSKYIGVDIYGKCGDDSTCPRNKNCYREIAEPNYFFYLSFENSLCQDYVTEKLYNALRYYVVPVVYGGADYSKFAPPNSYVNALDFDSPKELAKYLQQLSRNPREYVKYFRWKKHYRVDSANTLTACKLCELLHTRQENKYYSPLTAWYSLDVCPLQRYLGDQKYATKSTLKSLY